MPKRDLCVVITVIGSVAYVAYTPPGVAVEIVDGDNVTEEQFEKKRKRAIKEAKALNG